MPEMTIAVLVDDDGDEFPVAMIGGPPRSDGDRAAFALAARQRIETDERARPTGSLTLARIEYDGASWWVA